MSAAASLAAGVVLEHLLVPQLHDAQGHAAVVHDAHGHVMCLECAVYLLQHPQQQQPHGQQQQHTTLRRKRLLLGVEAALDLLVCLDSGQQHYQKHLNQHHSPEGVNGACPLSATEAARRVLGPLLSCVLRPIADPHEREEMAGALVPAALKAVEVALLGPQGQGAAEEETAALLAAIYVPLLDAIRAQGLQQATHLLQLLEALLASEDGLREFGGLLLLLLAATTTTGASDSSDNNGGGRGIIEGGSISCHSQSQALSPPLNPSFAAVTNSFLAFLELVAAELAAPLPPGLPTGSDGAASLLSLRLDLLVLLRRLCEAPPARAWILRRRLPPRAFGAGFFQSMEHGPDRGGRQVTTHRRELLALAFLLLPASSSFSSSCSGTSEAESGGNGTGSGGGTGNDEAMVVEEMLRWQAEVLCPSVIKPLLLSGGAGDPQLQQLAAALVARLTTARPEAAEGLIEAELGEYLLESLRVLLRPSPSFDTGAAGISHHAAALRQLSGAAPIAFYSIAHFPPMIFRELLALIYPLLVRGGSGHDAALHGEEEGGEDALLALLDVLEGALAHSTVLFSEEALETLLQTLHEATARQLQRQQQQQDALCSPMLRRLALFVGRYVSSEVINNKALFPSPPQLEALLQALCGLLHVLLLLPPQGRIDVGGASTVLMAAAFPLLQVADLVTSRITPTRDGADMEEDEGDGRRATKEASHPSLPALVEAAAALASLAAAQQTVSRDPCDDYTCALFLSRVIVLLRDGPCLLHLTRRLLDAGLLETALLRLADAGGNGDDEHHTAALLSLAARLLTHGAGMQGAAVVEEARDPLLALARDLRQAQKHQHQQAAAADGQGEEMEVGAGRLSDGHPCQIVRRWLVGVVRRLADPLQLQRWNGVGTTRASSICNLDALLALCFCVFPRISGEAVEEGEAQVAFTTALEGVAASLAGAAPASLSSLTPTTVALLLQEATGAGGGDGNSSCSSALLQRAAAAALGGLSPPQLSEYADRRLLCGKVDQEGPVRHMEFLLLQGDQPGPQACWCLLLGKEQHQEQHRQRFTAALYRLPAHGSDSTAILALLVHGIASAAAAAHVDGERLCCRSLLYLHTASIVLGPALWGGASTEGIRALLILLHDRVLTVLAASISNSSNNAAAGTGEEVEDAASALRLVARIASAALTHAPCIAGEEPLPFVPLASRVLLLLSPGKDDAAARNRDAQKHAEVVAAVLALLNQLMGLGRLPPDAARTATVLDIAWASHAAAAPATTTALLANALLHALVSLPPVAGAGPAPSHCMYDRGFLTDCLAPQQPLPVRKAALVLLCRLMEAECARLRLRLHQQQRQRPTRQQQQQQQQQQSPTEQLSVDHRRLRLAAQTSFLEPELRGFAAAVLLQLPSSSSASSPWDTFLTAQALLPADWPHTPSTAASNVALYIAASLAQQRRKSEAAAAALAENYGGGDDDTDEQEEGGGGLVEQLLEWLSTICAALAQGQRDTVPASYPVVLQLLLAVFEAGPSSPWGPLTGAQKGRLRELLYPQASRSSSALVDDARLVDGGEQEDAGGGEWEQEAEGVEGVWWPPVLGRWMHAHGQDEGAEGPPTRPTEVDLSQVVARLREQLEV